MDVERMHKFIGASSLAIVDAMAKIDSNAKGVLFIVDKEERLIGTLSDGDIRRWLLQTGDLSANVSKAMNYNPHSVTSRHKQEAVSLMKEKSISAIPVLDMDGRIVDIYTLDRSTYENIKNKTLATVPVVIMAGGKGSRLYPYTKILPKPLIPIGDTPIIERIMDYYVGFGVVSFYMTVNYKKEMIRSYFEELKPQYTIQYVEEQKPLGTGGSIKLIEEYFEKPIFVTNSDALILADYADIYQYHLKTRNDITMVSALKNVQIPYGVLHTGENGILQSIEEKPKLSYFINTGMYVMNPEVIDYIPENCVFHMTDLVNKVMKNGGKVGTYPVSEDSFLDMGEFDEMKRMEEKLLSASIKEK